VVEVTKLSRPPNAQEFEAIARRQFEAIGVAELGYEREYGEWGDR